MSKWIFLDIDGVLNRDCTKETFKEFTGVDKVLCERFLSWMQRHDYTVALSSTWRFADEFMDELRRNGLSWICETPRLEHYGLKRGFEIEAVIRERDIKKYVILDDLHPGTFLAHQRPYHIQISPVHGVRDKNLKRAEEILG